MRELCNPLEMSYDPAPNTFIEKRLERNRNPAFKRDSRAFKRDLQGFKRDSQDFAALHSMLAQELAFLASNNMSGTLDFRAGSVEHATDKSYKEANIASLLRDSAQHKRQKPSLMAWSGDIPYWIISLLFFIAILIILLGFSERSSPPGRTASLSTQ